MTDKELKEINDRIKSIKVEHDFYTTGFPVNSTEPKSANHLFGNGKWKKECINAFGEDYFSNNCEKYGNKPIDFKLLGINTGYSSYFAPGEKIRVAGEVIRVMGIDGNTIIVMVPFNQKNIGLIHNQSRIDGAKKAMDRNLLMIQDEKQTSNFEQPQPEPKSPQPEPENGLQKTKQTPKINQKTILIASVFIILLLIGIKVITKKK